MYLHFGPPTCCTCSIKYLSQPEVNIIFHEWQYRSWSIGRSSNADATVCVRVACQRNLVILFKKKQTNSSNILMCDSPPTTWHACLKLEARSPGWRWRALIKASIINAKSQLRPLRRREKVKREMSRRLAKRLLGRTERFCDACNWSVLSALH